jgi:hypothetical protein
MLSDIISVIWKHVIIVIFSLETCLSNILSQIKWIILTRSTPTERNQIIIYNNFVFLDHRYYNLQHSKADFTDYNDV